MRTIMTVNSKGGCGKSTLAMNTASFFATTGNQVVLADLDPQQSSLGWLNMRGSDRDPIIGVNACEKGLRAPRDSDVMIIDAPAAVHGTELAALVKKADTLIIPVLPSPLDMRACARFVEELLVVGKISRQRTKMAVVANRVRENTLIYQSLEAFLKKLRIPFVTTLRDSQNYIRAAQRGVGIFELAPSSVEIDQEQWKPLLRWLRSKRSMPEAG